MKALSLIQPWASLVVMGAKKYETRSWNTSFRGRLLIHASKKKDPLSMNLCMIEPFYKHIGGLRGWYDLPFGAIIGECELESTDMTEKIEHFLLNDGFDLDEISFGNYSKGRRAWKLINPIQYQNPIKYQGQLNIWNFPDELLTPELLNKLCKTP